MRFWFEKFRKGDVGSTEHQRQIIDTFVNSVYVFDDRVVLNFNFTDDSKTVTREEVLGSSAVDNAPPYSSYSNLQGFGYVFCLSYWRNKAINEQRQGIIVVMVSCLFALQKKACFVRTWPPLQDRRLKTTSFQTKVFHCISRKSMFQ